MPVPKALTPQQASRTFVHRFGAKANRLRQLATKFGLRPYRTFLVWFRWTGEEVGEGVEREVHRDEILPTPKVTDATRYMFLVAGKIDDGIMILSRVNPLLGEGLLSGRLHPGQITGSPCPDEAGPPMSFRFMVKEDGRSSGEVEEHWFTPVGMPFRMPGKLDWNIKIQQVSK